MFIFSNLATSLDGKIATMARGLHPLGTPYDRKQMRVLRRKCDAVLMGAATLRSFQGPCGVEGQKKQPYNLILSSTLEGISPRWPFFQRKDISRVLFIDRKTPPKRIQSFSQTSEIVLLKANSKRNPTALQIIQHLEKLGLQRLLIEGGGGVMWDFVSQNLIDEYHVTLTPRLLGGSNSPTLVDGKGFDPSEILNLDLIQCKKLKNELYLAYRKTNLRGC